MRTLSAPFIAEQIKLQRTPLVKVDVASYAYPAAVAASDLLWDDFSWERLTQVGDATTLGVNHAVAIPADGSVCRVKAQSSKIYFQRITTPSSADDWTAAWTNLGSVTSTTKVAIAAMGTEVVVFADDGVNLYRRQSADSGATWAAWVSMANARPGARGIAAAYKSNGDLACVHASDLNDPTSLYIQIRAGGSWSAGLGQIAGDFELIALSLYHNGDWNLMGLILVGATITLVRGIYGDGGTYAAGTWSGWSYVNSYKTTVSFTGATRLRTWKTQSMRKKSEPTYYERLSAVTTSQASEDTLGVNAPFMTYHASLGAFFSFAKSTIPWFYRLRMGSAFASLDCNKVLPLSTVVTQGLALATDGSYLYATAPNQVWRCALSGSWAPPSAGAGAGADYPILATDIIAIKEDVNPLAPSTLEVIVDNSASTYDSIGGGAASAVGKLKRGAQVTLSIGYYSGGDLLSSTGKYYIESLSYSRRPGSAFFSIKCLDAWGLLKRYTFPSRIFWNEYSDATTAYAIITLIMQSIGGTLSYVTRSADIIGTYPRLEVRPGENAAVVLQQILSLFPDVIYFIGLTGYIVYPQAADATTYTLRFPT